MEGGMKDFALRYAEMGFAVLPIKPRSKIPITKNGFKDATTDPQTISSWWDRTPDANIAIATGSRSGGLVVIDLDRDKEKGIDGYETLKSWQKDHGTFPETWTSITGRKGYHLFYKDSATNRSRVKLYEGIDIRAEDGYVVVPPSIHENGNQYEWEYGPGDSVEIVEVDSTIVNFLMGPAPEGKQAFQMQEAIPEGERHKALIALIGSEKARGIGDNSIRSLIRSENQEKCKPPLTDEELEKEIFPALSRGWEASAPYYKKKEYGAVPDKGKSRAQKNTSPAMVKITEVEEKEPDWLICGYMPRYQITSLAGDGGSGKTTVWCALAAAVSAGKKTFLENFIPEGIDRKEPQKVIFFSAEDSSEYTLKRRLRKNGAVLENILTIDIADDRFLEVKFNSPYLESLLSEHRPALCIFDPIQAFVPPDIRMGDRNAMRNCLAPLIGHGEKYGTTFLIIEHANKQSGVWGRKRIADSADIWDISRSVIMAGETNDGNIRYLSHEKSNYGRTRSSVLYAIDDEVIVFKGYTSKKDKDFVTESDYNSRQAPQKEEAKDFIIDFLKDGEKEIAELDEMAAAMSISKNAIKNAKSELKREGITKTWSLGYGKEKKYFIRLVEGALIASDETNE